MCSHLRPCFLLVPVQCNLNARQKKEALGQKRLFFFSPTLSILVITNIVLRSHAMAVTIHSVLFTKNVFTGKYRVWSGESRDQNTPRAAESADVMQRNSKSSRAPDSKPLSHAQFHALTTRFRSPKPAGMRSPPPWKVCPHEAPSWLGCALPWPH